MTLNTFHFAGHGAANVTLGIPRLREIVMTASQNIKTPIMKLPILNGITPEQMKTFCKDGSRLLLSQVVDRATVTEQISGKSIETEFSRKKTYRIHLNFFPAQECLEEYNVSSRHILEGLDATFVPILEREISKELKRLGRDRIKQAQEIGKGEKPHDGSRRKAGGEDEADDPGESSRTFKDGSSRPAMDADDSDEEDPGSDTGGDNDADDAKRRQKTGVQATYDEGSSDEDESMVGDTEESLEAAFADDADRVGTDRPVGEIAEGVDEDLELHQRVLDVEANIQSSSKFVTSFNFDRRAGAWATLDLQLPINSQKLLLISVVERACRMSVVHEIPNISRILIPSVATNATPSLTAEGINFRDLWEFGFGVIDFNTLYTNDIGALLHTYGVEAARAAIVSEMAGIFATYGIDVSMRHLFLIADYQTAAGGFRPFSRGGIADDSSPLLKASFEMTMAFLANSALHGEHDPLDGPSGNIVVGRPVKAGTGAPEVRLPVSFPTDMIPGTQQGTGMVTAAA